MTDTPVQKAVESESEALSDIPDSSSAVFESPDTLKTATSSSHHDSEYDTASDTPSSDLEDEDDFEDDDIDDNGEESSVVLDLDRLRVDGEDDVEKKKVDDDEDRSNPQYIPKRGVFYEHDDRTAEEPEAERKADEEGKEEKSDSPTPAVKKPVKKSPAAADRWSHDRYNENEQAPKSRTELVNSYGYDIRNEDGPPRARRRRRYGRGPNKYTRNWEDEKAYAKLSSQQEKQQRNQQEFPNEFPELGTRKVKPSSREEKENKNDENRRATKSPNQRSQHQDAGHRAQSDRYDNNRSHHDVSDGNRQQDSSQNYEISRSQSGGNRSHDVSRSQNDRFDGNRSKYFENNRHNDRYDRQQNDHHDNNRSNNRYDSRYSNDQHERNHNDRYENKRSSDKFDGNRIDRYDQRTDRGGDKGNWDRRSGKMNDNRSGGFRNGKTTIEFKNQNRNKPFDNAPQSQSGTKGFASSGFNQRQSQNAEYESEIPIESLSFTNSKLSTVPQSMAERYSSNLDYVQMDGPRLRNVSEMDRPERVERPITGRQLGSSASRSSNQQIQQSAVPIASSIHTQQPSMNIQQQISSQPIQQQLLPQQQTNASVLATESRSAKRYSTLRQRTTEAVQNMSIPQHLHEQQMLDAALMLQMQQNQEQIQIQPNLAHQPPSTNYSAQPLPLQIQNEYAAHGSKSQNAGSAQTNQQALIQTPTQNSSSQAAQYPTAYFASNDFTGQPPSSIQPAAQAYPAQYPQQPAASPYVQPPPQQTYIQPAVNQPQQILNYSSIPPAQQPYSNVQSFPTYPTVPTYNSVPSGITQSGVTYYPPQSQPRPILSQRRPLSNAIPILPPSERFANKGRNRQSNNQFDEEDKAANAPIGSPENIDHILDNMFTQRAPFLPPTRKSNSPTPESGKVGDSQLEVAQTNITSTPTLDGGNKQLELVDAGIAKVPVDEISKMDNAMAVLSQNETVIDSTTS